MILLFFFFPKCTYVYILISFSSWTFWFRWFFFRLNFFFPLHLNIYIFEFVNHSHTNNIWNVRQRKLQNKLAVRRRAKCGGVHMYAVSGKTAAAQSERSNVRNLMFYLYPLHHLVVVLLLLLTILIYLMCFKFEHIYIRITYYVSTIFHNDLMPQLDSLSPFYSWTSGWDGFHFHIMIASNFQKFKLTIINDGVAVDKWNY